MEIWVLMFFGCGCRDVACNISTTTRTTVYYKNHGILLPNCLKFLFLNQDMKEAIIAGI